MSRFVDFIVYPGIFIRKIPPRFAVSVIFYQIYSTDVHSLWRSLFVIFIEIKYRESFHRIPEFHFERFFIIFLFLPLLLSSPLSFTIFSIEHEFRSMKISRDYQHVLSPVTESFLKLLATYPCIFIRHVRTVFPNVLYPSNSHRNHVS